MGGNGNDSMGVEREWEQESNSRTPLIDNRTFCAEVYLILELEDLGLCTKLASI